MCSQMCQCTGKQTHKKQTITTQKSLKKQNPIEDSENLEGDEHNETLQPKSPKGQKKNKIYQK